jgi:hypothetical protein
MNAGVPGSKRCSEREPAVSLRDESNVIGGWLPSLTCSLGARDETCCNDLYRYWRAGCRRQHHALHYLSCHQGPSGLAPRNQIALSGGSDPNRWLCDATFEGVTYVFTVPDTLLRSMSKWRADSDRVPLSPNRAEAAAVSKARRLRPDVQAWGCHSLALHRADADVWFYAGCD